ncbi:sigma 54-interacting transcriptional regulator [Desulfolutivibrio sulfoxidireducens]|uniref:sigma 54-interacting transcriptional regulator n=1 Tax=Desulfolutivibrio sulfoxidireducens TaxID=2773299 RepID=UPI00159CF51C|nr:sigma 54-interacting transcriptional regulator [Desulfolutivibrio sulfoxidireducens]
MRTRTKARTLAPDLARLAEVLDGLPLGVAALDLDGRILFMNKSLEALTGFSSHEAAGVPGRHVVRCGLHVSAARAAGTGGESLPSDGPPKGVESDIIDRRRHRLPVRVTPVAVKDGEGRVALYLEAYEDLTPLRDMEQRLGDASGTGQLVSRGEAMERVKRVLPAIAQSEASVLVTGETGTGKDLAAQVIHKASPRSRGPFVRVNLGPMSEHLLEAELYGRVAEGGESLPGCFQRANGGTLYLSEIADLPVAHQAGLVRVLDDQTVMPTGSDKSLRISVRIIAATHKDPEELVRAGALREDLFHRLSAVRVHLPPLRERGEDVEFLLAHFLTRFASRFKKDIKGFSPRAMRLLCAHSYPGNVRELRNIVEYAAMICQKDMILPAHLPAHILAATDTAWTVSEHRPGVRADGRTKKRP